MFRFTVGNGETKAQTGRENGLARPQVGFQFTRIAAAARQQQVIGHAFEHFFFAAPVAFQCDALGGDQRCVLLGHAELRQQVFHFQRSTAGHCLVEQLAALTAIKLRHPRFRRRN
ncbi:hypothetical protein ExPCM15_04411 [Escherichia coli]|nr:hypothetical protein ExPCM15_04411 [Escherichia coli]